MGALLPRRAKRSPAELAHIARGCLINRLCGAWFVGLDGQNRDSVSYRVKQEGLEARVSMETMICQEDMELRASKQTIPVPRSIGEEGNSEEGASPRAGIIRNHGTARQRPSLFFFRRRWTPGCRLKCVVS